MSSRKIWISFLAAALALPVLSMSADQPLTRSQSTEARATVVAVDPHTRMVTLKGEDGKTFDVKASEAVHHLDQVKPGDVVSVTYTESLAFQVAPRGEKPQGVSQSAKRIEGGREVGRQLTTSFRINSYEQDTHILWGTTAKGETKKIVIEDPQAQERLAKLSPGDVVQVTYSESVAIRLAKVGEK